MLAVATGVIQPPRSSSVFHQMIFAAALAAFLFSAASPARPQSSPQASIDELRLKVHESPSDPLAHYQLAVALYHQGRMSGAAQEFQKALELRPDLAEARNDLGIIWGQEGKPQEALQEFQEAVKLNPHYFEARYNLALALLRAGKPEFAAEVTRQGLEEDSHWFWGYYALGLALDRAGQLDDAQ
jgi:tetratricopeptide (TPR) repeat protein